jgi:hypothetical protein
VGDDYATLRSDEGENSEGKKTPFAKWWSQFNKLSTKVDHTLSLSFSLTSPSIGCHLLALEHGEPEFCSKRNQRAGALEGL